MPSVAADASLPGPDAGPDGASDAGVDAGWVIDPISPDDLVRGGGASTERAPRPSWGVVKVAGEGARLHLIEAMRVVDPGQSDWRARFRLVALERGLESWSFPADPDDQIADVAVHPSGDLTLAIARHQPASSAFDLVRLRRDGSVLARLTMTSPSSVPEGDYAADDPRPLFRMKADPADALSSGWVQLLADGEGLIVAFLSYLDVPESDRRYGSLAMGLAVHDWSPNGYSERWARVVEGRHLCQPAGWAYDELRWREQAIRPFLARDEETGDILVGRAWNSSRCAANVRTFGEFTQEDCEAGAVRFNEVERLPLAVTGFSRSGTRLGTRVIAPDSDAAEQVPFAMAVRGGRIAVAGSLVRMTPDHRSKRTYPDANGYVDYDGYIAFYGADGHPLAHQDFNQGRGDVLAALRWTRSGVFAVGSAGWDRWQGGMSISRGADPLLVWLSAEASTSASRVIPLSDGSRHFNLHDLALDVHSVTAFGVSDAPMTHSSGGGNAAAATFGFLRVTLDAESVK